MEFNTALEFGQLASIGDWRDLPFRKELGLNSVSSGAAFQADDALDPVQMCVKSIRVLALTVSEI